ncbi:MAG: hypothetical protein KC492_35595, partial [Myxococcales bacterium]|nr:hypothetical protein [Myxococcales bacterium]
LGLPSEAGARAGAWARGAWPRLRAATRAADLEDGALSERRRELTDELRELLERSLEVLSESPTRRDPKRLLQAFARRLSGT